MIVWGKEECLKMTFERLNGKINVLEIVRQRVPGCRTGVGKRPSPVRGQIDTGEVQFTTTSCQLSVGDGDQERRTQVGRVPTGIQVPCCVDTCTPGHTLWTAPGRRRLIVVKRFTFAILICWWALVSFWVFDFRALWRWDPLGTVPILELWAKRVKINKLFSF